MALSYLLLGLAVLGVFSLEFHVARPSGTSGLQAPENMGGSRLPGCHGDLPAVPELPRALPR